MIFSPFYGGMDPSFGFSVCHHHFSSIYTLCSNLLLSTMVQTRSQLENLSKGELIDEN